jgi:hypothetical protein
VLGFQLRTETRQRSGAINGPTDTPTGRRRFSRMFGSLGLFRVPVILQSLPSSSWAAACNQRNPLRSRVPCAPEIDESLPWLAGGTGTKANGREVPGRTTGCRGLSPLRRGRGNGMRRDLGVMQAVSVGVVRLAQRYITRMLPIPVCDFGFQVRALWNFAAGPFFNICNRGFGVATLPRILWRAMCPMVLRASQSHQRLPDSGAGGDGGQAAAVRRASADDEELQDDRVSSRSQESKRMGTGLRALNTYR